MIRFSSLAPFLFFVCLFLYISLSKYLFYFSLFIYLFIYFKTFQNGQLLKVFYFPEDTVRVESNFPRACKILQNPRSALSPFPGFISILLHRPSPPAPHFNSSLCIFILILKYFAYKLKPLTKGWLQNPFFLFYSIHGQAF